MAPVTRPVATASAAILCALASPAQDRETRVRSDRERVEAAGRWIYGDLGRGVAEAKQSGKPLLVVFRCIPCEACAKLDEDVVTGDPVVQDLLQKFVCVRIPTANGMDLSLFQFDLDQSWAAFLLNADLTIYGRYGTRSHRTESERDVSLQGFALALAGALQLHADFAKMRPLLQDKRGAPLEVGSPEAFPAFGGKYAGKLDYSVEKVVPTCIHCHQVGEAERRFHRDAGMPIPERLLFPYPNPRVLGLVMDPKAQARVQEVVAGTAAAQDGFRVGDEIALLEGQPMLSVADVQWVLHQAPETGKLAAEVVREGKPMKLSLSLASGWRRQGDISWRATSWDLRRMTTGGMVLQTAGDELRQKLGVANGAMALVVERVGEYGEHAAAKKAGFQKDDVIVAVDSRSDVRSESEWMAWLVDRRPGAKVPVTVRRRDQKLELVLPMQ
jgi:serine protease Do